MANLTKASGQLFRRSPDESYESLGDILRVCRDDAERSTDRWRPPKAMTPGARDGVLGFYLGDGNEPFRLNDWSFSQLCGIAKVSKDTLNQLTAETAARVFSETLPGGNKPAQLFTRDNRIRSIHGHSYARLHDSDLVAMLMEFAVDFTPPQRGGTGGSGLYRGEQDLFCFMIDPTGWIEVGGESFAPGFFAWNSEVGRRSVGIQSFWFQAVCANHIVWDAIDVTEFARKHVGEVGDALGEMRRIVEALVKRRDERRDSFATVVKRAMETRLGSDSDEVIEVLGKSGISRLLAKRAIESATGRGRFTIFSLVDAITKIAGEVANAGDRLELDQKASKLLGLAGVPVAPWEELPIAKIGKG